MNVKIKKFGRFTFSVNYVYDEHCHDDYEINYITAGKCIMTINDKNTALHKGDCIVIEPGTRHNFIVGGTQSCEITQLEFLSDRDLKVIEDMICLKIMNCTDVLESMGNLYHYHKRINRSEFYKELFDLELQKLFVLLSMHRTNSSFIKEHYEMKPLNKIIEYIDNNFDQTLDLDEIAANNNISARYLRKIFSQYIGFSAIDYITMLRMEKAKDMLKNSTKSISEIAISVGYNSFQYFSTIFKKKIGKTPKEFRRQYTL